MIIINSGVKNLKYILLDFGNVIAYPSTGDWFITPKFLDLINMNLIDLKKLREAFKHNQYLLDLKIITLEEEYEMFTEFYYNSLNEMASGVSNLNTCKEIAYNRVYKTDKYRPYPHIKQELKALSKKYTLLLLSDNWPDYINHMNEYGITDLFDKLYISSVYGQLKKDGDFFDNPINDFGIQENEGLFIDDNESLLSVAENRKLQVRLMDRDYQVKSSNYRVIHDLKKIL